MTRQDLQQLARDRVIDAKALLDARRYPAAYYIVGYAVEASLKSCVLAHIDQSGRLFTDQAFARSLADCWTHDLKKLIRLAGLQDLLDGKLKLGGPFPGFWGVVNEWNETSRYVNRNQIEAEELYEAVSQEPDGVIAWIRRYW